MKLRNPRKTVVSRTQQFIETLAFEAIEKKDSEVRMTYMAMGFYLGGDTIGAMKRLGFIRADGWKWYWEGPNIFKMDKKRREETLSSMALKIRKTVQETRVINMRHAAYKKKHVRS